MVIADKARGTVTNTQRMALRHIPLQQIEKAYLKLLSGYSEFSVCTDLDLYPDIFQGDLQQALEEALWERGHLPLKHLDEWTEIWK
jgi:hypothetical protein